MYIILAVIVIYATVSYGRFLYVLKSNRLPEIIQQNSEQGSGELLTYVAAGDSTSVGVGASDIAHTYTYKVFQKLSEQNKVKYVHVGKSGARTNNVIEEQLPKIIEVNPDIITLSIGANDITHLKSNASILENYSIIIERLLAETHAQIYLTNTPILKDAPLLPWIFRQVLEAKAQVVNRELLKLENDRVHVVPIHDFGWDQYLDIKVTFAQDQFHPSDIGYENWTNAFLTTMNKLHD